MTTGNDRTFVSWRDITYIWIGNAGAGGIGRVSKVLATDGPWKGAMFALKVFSPDSSRKEDWRRAFMREVHVLRNCDHPAIVRVFDEGEISGRPFFVMEHLPNTLHSAISDDQLSELQKLGVVMQLLSALDYLSRRDPYVVHRDIKPKNIFLKEDTCVLGDFGLVFQDTPRREQTGEGIPAMAQEYRTPELVAFHNGGPKPPPASDIFQLGLVAAKLFTGKNPLKHAGAAKPVEIEPLDDVPGKLGQSIKSRIEEMLILDTSERRIARHLLPLWLELYRWRAHH